MCLHSNRSVPVQSSAFLGRGDLLFDPSQQHRVDAAPCSGSGDVDVTNDVHFMAALSAFGGGGSDGCMQPHATQTFSCQADGGVGADATFSLDLFGSSNYESAPPSLETSSDSGDSSSAGLDAVASSSSNFLLDRRAAAGRRRKFKPTPDNPGFTAKNHRRHFVEHNYHDRSVIPVTKSKFAHSPFGPGSARQALSTPFPVMLFHMLEATEKDGQDDIVRWCPHGRAFMVNDSKRFMDEVMPNFFRQSKISSFQRQLNLYGFRRLNRKSPDKGSYYHEYFLRGRLDLCGHLQRTKVKGVGVRTSSNPVAEPNFYAMEPVGVDRKPEPFLGKGDLPISSPLSMEKEAEREKTSTSDDKKKTTKTLAVMTSNQEPGAVPPPPHPPPTVVKSEESVAVPPPIPPPQALKSETKVESWHCSDNFCRCNSLKCEWFLPSSDTELGFSSDEDIDDDDLDVLLRL